MSLEGKNVAILIAPRGTEEPEFVKPRDAAMDAGATVTVVSFEKGKAETVNNDLDPGNSYPIVALIGDVDAADFDGLIIPGGTVGADNLRGNAGVVAFAKAFVDAGKPVAAICHAPWVLVEADVVRGRHLTSYETVQTDIENAGGSWVDQEVVIDQGIITSRTPDDLPAFCAAFLKEFAKEPASAARCDPA